MDLPVTLLCRNPSTNKDKRMEQALYCALIEGYTDAAAELSRYIVSLYRQNHPAAYLVSKVLEPLRSKQNQRYNRLVGELNDDPCPENNTEMPDKTPFFVKAIPSQLVKDIKKTAYEKYQLDWLQCHGYSLQDFIDELNFIWKNSEMREKTSPGTAFREFEDTGFCSEIWVCYEEFLDFEYRDKQYMKRLLNEEEYLLYIRDSSEGSMGAEPLHGEADHEPTL